ncbi:MAG: hypothetical protein ACI9QA_000793 [Methanobacteriota archaeon]|jgi:hypothetical protein
MPNQDADYSPKYDDWSDGYPPDWNSRKTKVKRRDNYRCQECGDKCLSENDVRLHVHHTVPKSDGGSHTFDNLQTLCVQCHSAKHPDNWKLARMADDTSSVIALFFLWLVELFSDDSEEQSEETSLTAHGMSNITTDHERAHVTADVNRLWNPNHEDQQQVGLLDDSDDRIRFTSWKTDEVKQVQEGNTYDIQYARVGEYEGDPQLTLDTYTEIERV